MSNGTTASAPQAAGYSLLHKFIADLNDEELISSGPDIIVFVQYLGTSNDPIGIQLQFHRMVAALLADQTKVKADLAGKYSGLLVTSLQAAIDAAKARQAAPAA